MSLKLNATFIVAGITVYAESDSVAGLVESIKGAIEGLEPKTGTAASTPAPAPTETAKGKKSASTEKAAASSPPADSTKEASAASAPTPASPSPAAAPAVAEVTYEKSGLGEKIAGYLGKQDSAGYADRRAKLVDLLKKYGVTSGKNLNPAQFEGFAIDLAALAEPADDLG
jgi:hypothetical protein